MSYLVRLVRAGERPLRVRSRKAGVEQIAAAVQTVATPKNKRDVTSYGVVSEPECLGIAFSETQHLALFIPAVREIARGSHQFLHGEVNRLPPIESRADDVWRKI